MSYREFTPVLDPPVLMTSIKALLAFSCLGQQSSAQPSASALPVQSSPIALAAPSGERSSSGPLGKLLIGPGDECDVAIYGIPDLSQRVRVNSTGEISLALVSTL